MLEAIYKRYTARNSRLLSKLVFPIIGQMTSSDRALYLDGLISSAWQNWCGFARQVVISSCLGCQTRSGAQLTPVVFPARWEVISYISMIVRGTQKSKIKNLSKITVTPVKTNSILQKEMTWGDVDKLSDLVTILNPNNSSTLISSFSGGLDAPKDLQAVRNACQHHNYQTKAEVRSLASRYIVNTVRVPQEAALWQTPNTGKYAFESWLEDLDLMAFIATA